MSTTPSPTQSEFSEGSLPIKKRLVELLAIDPANLKNDRSQSEWRGLYKRVPLALTCLLITFCIGVVATLAWLSYEAREAIPGAPIALSLVRQQLDAMSLNLDAVRQNVDRIAASQEQITRNVDQLTASQEQVTREIKAIDQYIRSKNSEPPALKPAPRPSQQRRAR